MIGEFAAAAVIGGGLWFGGSAQECQEANWAAWSAEVRVEVYTWVGDWAQQRATERGAVAAQADLDARQHEVMAINFNRFGQPERADEQRELEAEDRAVADQAQAEADRAEATADRMDDNAATAEDDLVQATATGEAVC